MLSTSRLQALQVIVNVLRSDDFCVQRTYRREKGDKTTRVSMIPVVRSPYLLIFFICS